ncbi:hypothetical protein A2303_05580 [Candidatus Falkowbacteria bacterium RIFOXYB2_FULL_47_14]|uniref:DUF5667 domain-containing protein n=1 Tax=Candidatus Falkowbacteria bacterium RIFOXYA2_FULL_47_19 TaxID=1797994 RepID=A0A1F5SED5_9BACT|nr:MAG: hypothetical protein A2227_06980 [Candidatus Falkowbacteria bacterium RIFOXYA2_FULL_47_19]OGF35318.1 MAG: hypothetical protein A2468_00135 [Candidatus Falkowbacteria bacterium RIFOXYC2_FULL_46_15]OGF43756.1 MAG: hypothetical protein A2303_05580 [Candidatus Falkowbacteria bacterium RIFOXYB2_FULL_47_14]
MERGKITTVNALSVLALIAALSALGFSWLSFSGYRNNDAAAEEINEIRQEIKTEKADLDARSHLLSLKTRIMSGEDYSQIAQEAEEVRENLKEAYGEASLAAQERWREIDGNFEALRDDLRSESVGSIQSLQNALEALQKSIETDGN